ncbi:alpha/beta hydrolase [Pseudomonas sp. RGM 3321]|uniref:alpha/beta fold hydrolase n=1 Tax=Pseudomonas sp. RGM 3321 TaxID=2930089 RepID=UPI001FCC5D60|nr:alpha/beta hydrolase [Pseudomonas sp. RGM 3321]MCJ2373060.1 alpha/beta hydrolase [Pseudomonas sp. RGM 3321]
MTVEDVQLNVAAIHRAGVLAPIVFLHGFGSTKEDYADIVQQPAFAGHPFVAYDASGCGESQCDDLSRIAIPFLLQTALQVLAHFGIERPRHAPGYASALYSASLQHKVRAGAVRGIFQSMVDLSDNADLMGKFLGLKCPRMFMYGEQNASLSYLSHIQAEGVRLAPIPDCGHFPMYSNPIAMWQQIANFQASSLAG